MRTTDRQEFEMAGDWIKWTKGLSYRREVLAVAHKLGMDRRQVASLCMEFWEWADDNTMDGHVEGVTAGAIDGLLQAPGFADALVDVGWLRCTECGITVPRFDRHNGEPAKKRALDAERQRKSRERVTNMSRNKRDESVTREEKRREEIKTPEGAKAPSTPTGGQSSVRAGPVSNGRPQWSVGDGWSGISDERMARWSHAYPACDIQRQLSAMDAWLRANPSRAVKSNYERFIVNWLSKEQDRGGDQTGRGAKAFGGTPQANTDRRAAVRAERERPDVETTPEI